MDIGGSGEDTSPNPMQLPAALVPVDPGDPRGVGSRRLRWLEYDGVYVKLEVLDKTFATGVSDERGSIPRFGESVISVPVTVSTLRAALNTLGFVLGDKPSEKVRYKLSGKLAGPTFGSTTFQADGEPALPAP
jgi:late embryogenesis abundant protein